MAENASGEVEDAQRRAAPHGAGVDDVAHAAGAYSLLLACPAGVSASLVRFLLLLSVAVWRMLGLVRRIWA
jgi:hypothetical protein